MHIEGVSSHCILGIREISGQYVAPLQVISLRFGKTNILNSKVKVTVSLLDPSSLGRRSTDRKRIGGMSRVL